jgi:hypothetical protein
MGWLKDQWEQIRGNFKYEVLRWIAFGGSVTVLGLVVGFWKKLAHHPASSLELVLIPLVGWLIMCAFALYTNRVKGSMKLLLTPSEGPGTHQILIVKNLGKRDTFSAFCEIIGHPNGVNDYRRGEFRCGWGDGSVPKKTIPSGETESILISSFSEVVRFDLSEMILWEVIEGKKNVRGSFRWNQHPDEQMPSFNMKIRFTSESSGKSQTCICSVGPYSIHGPLRMQMLERPA